MVKIVNRHISVKNCPILMKFGTLHQILNPVTVTWQKKLKFLKFKMAAAAILKIAFLAINHRAIVRFQRNFAWGSRTAGRPGLRDKKCKFLESKMADGRHFENRKIAISQCKILRFWWNLVRYIRYWTRLRSPSWKSLFGHKSSTDCPISAKFCMSKQNSRSTRATGQKLQIFRIQHGRWPPFSKS